MVDHEAHELRAVDQYDTFLDMGDVLVCLFGEPGGGDENTLACSCSF